MGMAVAPSNGGTTSLKGCSTKRFRLIRVRARGPEGSEQKNELCYKVNKLIIK